ncbi:uncharacterized protein BX664DRAFT_338841 [Halteromyces radiatus]|uniref:uncharacterized protein n=1 Tax=Halteromyces radiatus TaxID=101107 RepID=UPI00221EF0C5|nr:uncharacterized protein BX664DRAFT_338841 [Halteromyces radiatus]KAI8085217.1 hypothetical protein BX664DRAFT_338841 [Halteromyces radiatus]
MVWCLSLSLSLSLLLFSLMFVWSLRLFFYLVGLSLSVSFICLSLSWYFLPESFTKWLVLIFFFCFFLFDWSLPCLMVSFCFST